MHGFHRLRLVSARGASDEERAVRIVFDDQQVESFGQIEQRTKATGRHQPTGRILEVGRDVDDANAPAARAPLAHGVRQRRRRNPFLVLGDAKGPL
jgi:hypothetical protein